MPQNWSCPDPWIIFSELVTLMDLCRGGHSQTVSHIVNSWYLSRLEGVLDMLNEAREDVVNWAT